MLRLDQVQRFLAGRGRLDVIAPLSDQPGESVAPGQPLVRVYEPQALRIEVAVPQTRAEAIRRDPRATVLLPGGREVAPAEVIVFPAADAASHSVNVRLRLPDLDPVPAPGTTAEVNGYDVELDGGLRPGAASELKLKVSRDGRPVTDLQPYLGAYGHLVALRSGDLAYLHVHPNGEPGDGTTEPGPDISFTATAPSAGTYRLFLDFKHDGEVHTATFTVHAGEAAEPGPEEEPPAGHTH